MIIKSLCFTDPPSVDASIPLLSQEPGPAQAGQPPPTETPSTSGASKTTDPTPPFILGDGLAPIPSAVVKKIQALKFVDFSELMPTIGSSLGEQTRLLLMVKPAQRPL